MCLAIENSDLTSSVSSDRSKDAYTVSVKRQYCRHVHEHMKYIIGATLNNLKILEMPLDPQAACRRERGLYF